jgi:hypothetical protein
VSSGTSIGALSYESLKEEPMSLNRIVALLTPLVFAPLAGVVSTWAADNLPGVTLPADKLEEVFIAGALIALAPAAQWLHGWQKYEQRQEEAITAAATGFGVTSVVAEAPPPEEDLDLLDEEFDLDGLDDLDDFDEFEDTSIFEEEQSVPVGS